MGNKINFNKLIFLCYNLVEVGVFMNQEILSKMKTEFAHQRHCIDEHNEKVKRIKELEKDLSVKEYLALTGIKKEKYSYIRKSNEKVVSEIYGKYLPEIDETNGLYFYLGTYKNHRRVKFDNKKADYRRYFDIEGVEPIIVDRKDFLSFEKENTILSTYYHSRADYNYIQNEFFTEAITNSEEAAVKKLIKKYHV